MSQEENKIKGISEIVHEIVDLYQQGKEIDQYSLVSKICGSCYFIHFVVIPPLFYLGKYGIPCPKFTDIILAIPEDYRYFLVFSIL